MAKAAAVGALLFAVAASSACSPFGGASAFTCTTNEDCSGSRPGVCEADSLCSFEDTTCSTGRRYGELSGGQSNKCVGGDTPEDAPVDEMVIQPEAGDSCFGTGGLVEPCFAPANMPSGAIALTTAIDTTTSPLCSATVTNTTACVIAGASISIANGVTIRVTGTRSLVLLATGTIQIDGTLDVASHRAPASIGAAGNFAGCDAGTVPTNMGGAGGGGAGGSFGTQGGNGGGPGATDGVAGAAQVAADLRGGCAGQNGKEGAGAAATRGIGGAGGGVVYLIADTSITIAAGGVINASGAAGSTGVLPAQLAGGGGGGSGGLIGFDSPTVTNNGQVFANGGSGGEGTGNNSVGSNGNEPTSSAAAPAPADQSGNGGNGAAGAAGTGAGGLGGTTLSGGGGGGGVGVIRRFRAAAIGGNISPPAN